MLDAGYWMLDAGSAGVVVTTAASFEAYENESGNKLPHSKGEAVVLPNRVSSIQYRASSIQYHYRATYSSPLAASRNSFACFSDTRNTSRSRSTLSFDISRSE
jgi:hypothetical protein